MNDSIDKENLKSKLSIVISELDSIQDPLDKIDRVADFVKDILIAYDTKEVVLATPVPGAVSPEDFVDYVTDDYESLDELYEDLRSGNKIIWSQPYWIYVNEVGSIERNIYFYNRSLWTAITIVRLGIINDKLMVTLQLGKAENEEDSTDLDNLENETDWIKPGNFYSVEDWIDLAKLLLTCDDIWKFNTMYPDLKKMNA
ncbi:MAG: hypothetical protein HDS78_03275 [Bacteroidales bacterium]|nr:hypothetical protein [Bacteroidales bacterium]